MLLSSPTKDPIKVQSVVLLILIEVNIKYKGLREKPKSLWSVAEDTTDIVPGAKLWPCRLLVFFPKVVLGVDKYVTNNAGTFAV